MSNPAQEPSIVRKPGLRPPTMVFFVIIAVSGPGNMMSKAHAIIKSVTLTKLNTSMLEYFELIVMKNLSDYKRYLHRFLQQHSLQ